MRPFCGCLAIRVAEGEEREEKEEEEGRKRGKRA
jgi:hypothetical protein